MPKIQGVSGPYRFFFYSLDCQEPKHVHVRRDRQTCKYWLEPLALCKNQGFSPHELNEIRRLIQSHLPLILDAWHEHCE